MPRLTLGYKMSNLYWLDLPDEIKDHVDSASNLVRPRIKQAIGNLRTEPRPATAKPLRSMPDHYRIVIDSYRIYYTVDDDEQIVHLLRIGRKHGPEFYEL